MGVDANNGGLEFQARINTERLEQDADRVGKIIDEAARKAAEAEAKLLGKISGANKEAVKDGLEALKALTPEMQKQIAILQTFQAELNQVNAAQKELDKAFQKGKISQQEYNKATQGLSVRYAEINENVRKYGDRIQATNAIMNAANGSIDQKRLKLQQMTAQYYALSEAERNNSAVGGKLATQIRALDKEISKANGTLKGFSQSNQILGQILAATAGLFTLSQAGRYVSDIIRVRGEIEQLEVAFTTILRSKSAADALVSDIARLALNTPFKLTEVGDAAKQLLAYGFALEEVETELLKIGNIAAGTGSTFGEVAYAYGTLRSQGVAFARDIRQFTGRGIPIMAELAKQFNTSEAAVMELVSAGKIGFPEVSKAFESMTGSGGMFFNLMQEQSKTVTGQLSNLTDSIQIMFNEIGKGNEGLIKDGISGLKTLVDNYQTVIEILEAAVILYGSYRAALLLTLAAQKLTTTATGALTAAQAIQSAQTAILTKVTAIWGAALAALPIIALTGTIAALTAGIYSWSQAVDGATAAAESLDKIQKNAAVTSEKEKRNIEELVKITGSQVASLSQKESAFRNLQKILGPYLNGFTMEEVAAGKAQKAIEAYTEALKKSAAAKEAFTQYQELGDKILEIEQKGGEALGFFETFGQSLRNTLDFEGKTFGEAVKGIFFTSDDEAANRALENLKKQRQELAKAFDFTDFVASGDPQGKIQSEFDKLIGNVTVNFDRLISIAASKPQLDKIKEGLQNFMEELAPSDPQINQIKKRIQKVNEALKAYSLTEENKQIKDAAAERKRILEEISKLENEAFKDSFSKREQEIASTRKQFEDLRKEAEKAGLGGAVITRIDKLEEKATGNIIYRDETENLKRELEKRKSLYRDLENYALDFGIQAAEERYKTELDTAKRYLDLIEEEYNKLAAIDPANRSGVQQERFEFLEKEVREERTYQQKKYDDFLKTVQDYEQKRAGIIEQYAIKRQELIEKGDNEYLAQLEINFKEELGELDDQNAQKLAVFRAYYAGLENLSVKAAKKLIGDLRKTLDLLRSQGRITEEFYRQMIQNLNEAEAATSQRIPDNLKAIAQAFRGISQDLGGVNSGLGRMLGILGNSLDRVAGIQEGIKAFNKAQTAGDTLGAATAGLGVVGAAVSIVSGIVSVIQAGQQKQIEFQKKQLELQRQIYFGELDINRLYRERALAAAEIENNTLKSLLNQKDILKANMDQIREDIEGIEKRFGTKLSENSLNFINSYLTQRRSDFENVLLELQGLLYDTGETKTERSGFLGLSEKTVKIYKDLAGLTFEEIEQLSLKGQLTEPAEKLFQELKNLKEEGIEVENQLKEIENQLKSIFTGGATAFNIADTLISGFQQGKRAVEDFGQDVEEILRNAILSGFKYRFLEEPLNALLEQLYKDAVSDDALDSSEIQNFRDAFGQIVEQYGKAFEDLQTATGVDLSGILNGADSQRGLAGAIRREMTEETAGELAGLWRGQFDITKKHLTIATDSLQVQAQIELNTRLTAQEMKAAVSELKEIKKNTTPATSRGLGLDG